ncbi:Helix-turn-helix domain-containing protein [Arenibacter nanhaiticus]|uniref:Helix-turn-helix domain-containing protein n=1 Tax=Arenibacter nanhaiticus TaxID=558155 RepID=A0A1M6KWC2_9FLAO|nr:helix-turn-helix domain-containing protein [Arenibacter nanhaiticus]SHJ63267.1 Helix-turn-helix domain-containing protein [Arenibacter nanhaiticus]
MAVKIITTEDLGEFKMELLQEIKELSETIITTDDLRELKMDVILEIKDLLKQKRPEQSKKEWLKSTQVLEMLQISPTTLLSLRMNGTIPFVKIGGLIFYDAEEIEKVLIENTVKTSKKRR